jgi:hypothetical protein
MQYYTIEYRKKGETKWITDRTNSAIYTLLNLNAETTYEYRVKTACDDAPYSDIMSLNTKKKFFGFDEQKFNIYPNPAHNQLTMTMDAENEGSMTVEFFDMKGSKLIITNYENTPPSVQLDMTDFPEGMYMMVVTKNGEKAVKKVLKVRD